MATVIFTMNLPAEVEREGDLFVARFPHLDVASQGATREEAQRNLIEAAQLFIESCFERDTLGDVLKACGFSPGHAVGTPGKDHLTVPVELLAANNGPKAHAR